MGPRGRMSAHTFRAVAARWLRGEEPTSFGDVMRHRELPPPHQVHGEGRVRGRSPVGLPCLARPSPRLLSKDARSLNLLAPAPGSWVGWSVALFTGDVGRTGADGRRQEFEESSGWVAGGLVLVPACRRLPKGAPASLRGRHVLLHLARRYVQSHNHEQPSGTVRGRLLSDHLPRWEVPEPPSRKSTCFADVQAPDGLPDSVDDRAYPARGFRKARREGGAVT
jgi:hypothetical protein